MPAAIEAGDQVAQGVLVGRRTHILQGRGNAAGAGAQRRPHLGPHHVHRLQGDDPPPGREAREQGRRDGQEQSLPQGHAVATILGVAPCQAAREESPAGSGKRPIALVARSETSSDRHCKTSLRHACSTRPAFPALRPGFRASCVCGARAGAAAAAGHGHRHVAAARVRCRSRWCSRRDQRAESLRHRPCRHAGPARSAERADPGGQSRRGVRQSVSAPRCNITGFQASPLQGTEQGLAVYVNGARFNQPFGDTIDWEVIPSIAIDRVEIEGSNPVFGLNALGGSLNVRMKTGFTYQGGEADASGGSFDQEQGDLQYGAVRGNTAIYLSGNALHQDGWRDLQSSDIRNFYGDLGWKRDAAEVHLNLTLAELGPERPRHVAGRAAGSRSAGAVHRAERDLEQLCRDQRQRHLRTVRRYLAAGGRLLPVSAAASGEWQCGQRRALRRRLRPALQRSRHPIHHTRRRRHSRLSRWWPRIPSSTSRPPTPTVTASRRRSPTPRASSACGTISPAAAVSTARRRCSAPTASSVA